jgi:hypothetical protein
MLRMLAKRPNCVRPKPHPLPIEPYFHIRDSIGRECGLDRSASTLPRIITERRERQKENTL